MEGGARTDLRCKELLQVADGVIFVALDPDLLTETVVANHLNHAAQLPSDSTVRQYGPDPLGCSIACTILMCMVMRALTAQSM